ncbi:MAG: hypothetical protein ACPGWS_10455 [Solirubrobacterales bacterium]
MKILLDNEDRYLLEQHSWCLQSRGYLCTRINYGEEAWTNGRNVH